MCQRGFYLETNLSNTGLHASTIGTCTACPLHATGDEGSASILGCYCEAGHFDNSTSTSAPVKCEPCAIGTACRPGRDRMAASRLTLATLPIAPGYYRLSNNTDDIRRCPDASTGCAGDETACDGSHSGCAGTATEQSPDPTAEAETAEAERRRLQSSSPVQSRLLDVSIANHTGEVGCRPGLKGAYCKLCAPHPTGSRVYYRAGSSTRTAACVFCFDMAQRNILLALLVLVLVAVAAVAMLLLYKRYLLEKHRRQLAAAWRTFTPQNKLKVRLP